MNDLIAKLLIEVIKRRNVSSLLTLSAYLLIIAIPTSLKANGRIGNVNITFQEKKKVEVSENRSKNSIILEIKPAHYTELESLDKINEKLVKKVLLKQIDFQTVIAELVLVDDSLQATVDILDEPFRINIVIFDNEYEEKIEPLTGLPQFDDGLYGQEAKNNLSQNNNNNNKNEKTKFKNTLKTPDQTTHKLASKESKPGKRRLLKSLATKNESLINLKQSVSKVPAGRGKNWKTYPYYIYPLPVLMVSKKNEDYKGSESEGESLAEMALDLFIHQNEIQAQKLYEKVIQIKPSALMNDPLHIWALGEVHFGQGNFTLARGYYDRLAANFPENILSSYAQLRQIDIDILEHKPFEHALAAIESVKSLHSADLKIMKVIRKSEWQNQLLGDNKQLMPFVSSTNIQTIKKNINSLESKVTSYLAASVLLGNLLASEDGWDHETMEYVNNYFSTYHDKKYPEFFQYLKEKSGEILVKVFEKKYKNEHYAEIISIKENLKPDVLKVDLNHRLNWIVAESYRNLKLKKESIASYLLYLKKDSGSEENHLKSVFWIAVLSEDLSEGDTDFNEKNKYRKLAAKYDNATWYRWNNLVDEQKNNIRLTYKNHFESVLDYNSKLQSVPKIVLGSWGLSLDSDFRSASNDGSNASWGSVYAPSNETVFLVSKMIERFRELGMKKERRRAAMLLQRIKPQVIASDKEALKIWTSELVKVSNEMQKSKEFLSAGRLYAFIAENSIDWQGRAMAFYKAGLLLYKAGRREEAIAAFQKASSDRSNLFYANLAKERLTNISQ